MLTIYYQSKAVSLSQENFYSIKLALGLTDKKVSVRTVRQELFSLDNQDEVIFRDYTVAQLRGLLFEVANQEALV